jgi:2-oxoglutarate/2-oxoacid ferredoxin oxidoreductase subunit alpha
MTMKRDNERLELVQGSEAIVRGALYAGVSFYAGYPISPSTEIMELMSERLAHLKGAFIQMEDEISSIASAIGASIAGTKAMTSTSGPGFSLMQENIGYASLAEIPIVVIDAQRAGPSTGLPTSPSQGDVMQSRWGTHGDHPVIVVTPGSVQECFTLIVESFNMSEKYRVPVIFLTDEHMVHLRESVPLLHELDVPVVSRLEPAEGSHYRPYEVLSGEVSPRMARFGRGYRYNVTGLYHDENGLPTNDIGISTKLIERLSSKIENNRNDIIRCEISRCEGKCDVLLVSYGSTSGAVAQSAADLRGRGIHVSYIRLITLWPFPRDILGEMIRGSSHTIVVEMNSGQIHSECLKYSGWEADIRHLGRSSGKLITPDEISGLVMSITGGGLIAE